MLVPRFPSAFLALVLPLLVAGAAIRPFQKRGYPNALSGADAPYSLTQAQLDAVPLVCPYGVSNQARMNVLMIQGTGELGSEAFSKGYVPALHVQGFSTCYADLPTRSLQDAQVTSEYAVNLIHKLYNQGGNQPINVIAHSQGGPNVQWALNFFPSTRNQVASFVALAGDFHGTAEGQFVTLAQQATIQGAAPSVIQQSQIGFLPTKYLQALNKNGDTPLVPTTSLYGNEDEIIQPVAPDTNLDNVRYPNSYSHIDVSNLCLTTPAGVIDHFRMLLSAPTFWLMVDAFTSPTFIADTTGNRARSLATAKGNDFCSDLVPGAEDDAIPQNVETIVAAAISVGSDNFGTQRARTEPPLMPYARNQR